MATDILDSDTDSVNDVPVLLRIVKGNKRKRIIDSDDEDESRQDTTSEGHSDEGNTSSDGNQGSDDQDDQSSDKGEKKKVDKSSKGKNGEKKVIDQLSAFISGYIFYRYRVPSTDLTLCPLTFIPLTFIPPSTNSFYSP